MLFKKYAFLDTLLKNRLAMNNKNHVVIIYFLVWFHF